MFRSLFRRSRTVTVPIEHSNVQVKKVRIFTQALRPSSLLSTFFVAYFVYRLLESNQGYSEKDKGREQWDEWKKKSGANADANPSAHSDHWKTAHDALQKAKVAASASSVPSTTPSTPPKAVGVPVNLLATLPLPIYFRKRPLRSLQPAEKEHKEIARFQADAQKVLQVKLQVAMVLRSHYLQSHKEELRLIGFSDDCKLGAALEVIPLLPPPLYEIPTIMVFTDGIAIGWRPLARDIGTKMESIFRPAATLTAAKASITVFCRASYAIISARLTGVEPSQPSSSSRAQASESSAKSSTPDSNATSVPVQSLPNQSMQDFILAMHQGQSAKSRHADTVKNLPLSSAVEKAAEAFRASQNSSMVRRNMTHTRGCVQITGDVAFRGTRGNIIVRCVAIYSPAEDKIIGQITPTHKSFAMDYDLQQREYEQRMKQLKIKNAQITEQLKKIQDAKSKPDEKTVTEDMPVVNQKPQTGKEKE